MNYKDYTYEHTNCAMTPIQYEHLIDLLKNFKPKRICELGSGESTKIFEKSSGSAILRRGLVGGGKRISSRHFA